MTMTKSVRLKGQLSTTYLRSYVYEFLVHGSYMAVTWRLELGQLATTYRRKDQHATVFSTTSIEKMSENMPSATT